MTENAPNEAKSKYGNLKDIVLNTIKKTLSPSVEVAKAKVERNVMPGVMAAKETLLHPEDALEAAKALVKKNLTEFAEKFKLRLEEAGPVPLQDRIAPVITHLAFATGLGAGFLPIAERVLQASSDPVHMLVGGLLTLPPGIMVAEAYQYAMGRKEFTAAKSSSTRNE